MPLGGVALFFLYSCSGLTIPMLLPARSLNGHLSRVGVTLPAAASVPHGATLALRDSTDFFAVEMPVADAPAFVAALRAVGYDLLDHDPGVLEARAPAWWQPGTLPNVRVLSLHRPGEILRCYYSDTSGTLYMLRWEY
ncbi:MAG TPA: hypothetical protein VF796_04505 [Humisphaera sp.]